MQGVVLAAGEGTRLRPLTDDRPKALVEVGDRPLLAHCLDSLREVGVSEFVVVVGHRAGDVIEAFGEAYRGTPITYAHQRERLGLAHALLAAEPHVEGEFAVMNGDNVFEGAPLEAVADRVRAGGADAAVLTEEVPREKARETGVCIVEDDELVGVVEKPEDPPSTQVLTGFFAFRPLAFHACHLVRPSERGEYELADAIDLLCRARRRVEMVPMDGWRINVNTPADRDRAADRL